MGKFWRRDLELPGSAGEQFASTLSDMAITRMHAKRWLKMTGGFALLILGAAMLLLPGPGVLTIVVGLAILSTEFLWARLLLDRIKRRTAAVRDVVGRRKRG